MANTGNRASMAALIVACAASLAGASLALAEPRSSSLKPGEYVTEGAWGNLSLRLGNDDTLIFAIEATSRNKSVCSLDGELSGSTATLVGSDDKNPCIINFAQTGEGVRVSTDGSDACRDYCGVRAYFEGLYLRTSARCATEAVATQRKLFKQLYDTRQFAKARTALEPVLTLCSRTLSRAEESRIRNDLAITLHKLDDVAGCLLVLQPLASDAKLTELEYRERNLASDAETMQPILRATRANLKLCGGK